METLAEMKKIRAGALPQELYDEINEFLSSLRPDFAMSGKTSLYALYSCLEGAKKRKMPARELRRAERMIRALCAVADSVRGLRAKELAGTGTERRQARREAGRRQLELAPYVSPEAEKKFAQLGITDRKAMERVLAFIGEEEFSRRHARVLATLPERAYRVFFRSIPDFLTTPNFDEAVGMMAQKVRIIDKAAETRGGVPHGLDYTRDASVLLLTMQQVSAALRLDRLIASIKPGQMPMGEARKHAERLSDPRELRMVLENAGFEARETADGSACICMRRGASGELAGIVLLDMRPGIRYSAAMVSAILSQGGITGEDLRRGGAFA